MQSNGKTKILVVDDERDMRWALSTVLEEKGYVVITARDGKLALDEIKRERPNLTLLDIRLPVIDGMGVLQRAREIHFKMPIIMMTAFSNVETAVRALRYGADDYLVKPLDNLELLLSIERALDKSALEEKGTHTSTRLGERINIERSMGNSTKIQDLIANVKKVAISDFSVLIQGESGTGKELVAEAIHFNSSRAKGPFVVVDCGAIPETLIESELFGYEKGAFTGAFKGKRGLFEVAHKGTLFLDEVTNLSKSMQMKLLRSLESKQIIHLGGTRRISVDIRIVSASNRDLLTAVKRREFRQDLYYRLNEFTIKAPPLRERKDDIIFLANMFLDEVCEELNKRVDGFSKEAEDVLLNYNWPGNVRELRNIVRRSSLFADLVVAPEFFPDELIHPSMEHISMDDPYSLLLRGVSWKELKRLNQMKLEQKVFTRILKQTGGNKSKAARLLKMDYKTFHSKVKDLGIQSSRSSGGNDLN